MDFMSLRSCMDSDYTAWKVSKYGILFGPYFPPFGLNKERYEVPLQIKYGPEKTPYLDTFHAVLGFMIYN